MPQTVKVPAYVSRNAERGLKLHDEGRTGDGIQPETIREARDMVEGAISEAKVRKMGPWFRRHKADLDAPKNSDPSDPGYPGAGLAAWLIWGGDSNGSMRAAEWAERTTERLDREKEKEARKVGALTSAGYQMASLDEQLSSALAQVENLQAEAAKISESAAAALAAATAAAEEKARAEIEAANKSAADLAAQVAALTEKVAALESEKASAEKAAAKIVAAAAAVPADVSGLSDTAPKAKSREEMLAEFRAITDPQAKSDFYNANWKILAGL